MSVRLEGHQRIDQRSIALHRAIAAKLRANPELIAIALDNLDRWTPTLPRSRPYFERWREILHRPLAEILELLTEESEQMNALRQATPFAGIREHAERWAIYERFKPEGRGPL